MEVSLVLLVLPDTKTSFWSTVRISTSLLNNNANRFELPHRVSRGGKRTKLWELVTVYSEPLRWLSQWSKPLTDEGIRSKSQGWCSLLCANPTQEWNAGSRQRAPQADWRQSVVTNHVNIVTKIQNGFLTCPEFSPTSHHSFFLFVSFNFFTCPGYNSFLIFFFKYPKSNAEPEDTEILSCISGRNVHNSLVSHNKSIQKDRVKKNSYAFIFI